MAADIDLATDDTVSDEAMETAAGRDRRRLLRAAMLGASAFSFGSVPNARAQQKMTRKDAQYQDTPKGGLLMCGTCRLFEPPNGCKVVEGPVSPEGWCKLFDLAD